MDEQTYIRHSPSRRPEPGPFVAGPGNLYFYKSQLMLRSDELGIATLMGFQLWQSLFLFQSGYDEFYIKHPPYLKCNEISNRSSKGKCNKLFAREVSAVEAGAGVYHLEGWVGECELPAAIEHIRSPLDTLLFGPK